MKSILNKTDWKAWASEFQNQARIPVDIQFRNASDGSTEVLVYGEIGMDWFGEGVVAKNFTTEFAKIPAGQKINVRINSPGGNVHEGLAISNTLATRKADVTCHVDGIAASIASVIALAGNKLVMPADSMLMIHDVSGVCQGTADDMRDMAESLQKHTDLLAGIYARKTGKTVEEMKAAMSAETWMTATEAKAFGLADEIFETPSAGKVASGINNKTKPPTHKPRGASNNIMNREDMIALLNTLGVKFDNAATDEALKALLVAYKPQPAPEPVAVSNEAILAQVVKVDAIRNRVLACAKSGRISAASVADFTNRALNDESILASIEALPEREVGHEPIKGSAKPEAKKVVNKATFDAMNAREKSDFSKSGGRIEG